MTDLREDGWSGDDDATRELMASLREAGEHARANDLAPTRVAAVRRAAAGAMTEEGVRAPLAWVLRPALATAAMLVLIVGGWWVGVRDPEQGPGHSVPVNVGAAATLRQGPGLAELDRRIDAAQASLWVAIETFRERHALRRQASPYERMAGPLRDRVGRVREQLFEDLGGRDTDPAPEIYDAGKKKGTS